MVFYNFFPLYGLGSSTPGRLSHNCPVELRRIPTFSQKDFSFLGTSVDFKTAGCSVTDAMKDKLRDVLSLLRMSSKKRRELIENGTKRTSIRIRNLKLYIDGKEQPANLWQPPYCKLMLINARSNKKPNAVFHSSTDLAAQSLDWCFVTESWLNSDIDNFFISIPNYNLFRCDRSAKNSKKNHGVKYVPMLGAISYVPRYTLKTMSNSKYCG